MERSHSNEESLDFNEPMDDYGEDYGDEDVDMPLPTDIPATSGKIVIPLFGNPA